MEGIQRRASAEAVSIDERTIKGTLLRYGDRARLPNGIVEEFLPDAFGELGDSDLLLNVQHDRNRPIARTGGGGLFIERSDSSIEIRAELPNTSLCDDVLELVDRKILRGLSIEFLPIKHNTRNGVLSHTQARLSGCALVDRPAYPESLVREDGDCLWRIPIWIF